MLKLDPPASHLMFPATLRYLTLAARLAGLRDQPPSPERRRALEMLQAEQLEMPR